MSDDKKTQGDKEYVKGYETGRDGDPASRGFDAFFGYTDPNTTYGKGYQAGVEDRHAYGSRTPDLFSGNDKEDKPQRTNSEKGNHSYSSSSGSYSGTSYSGSSDSSFGLLGWIVGLIVVGLIVIAVSSGMSGGGNDRSPNVRYTNQPPSGASRTATLGDLSGNQSSSRLGAIGERDTRSPQQQESDLNLSKADRRGIQRFLILSLYPVGGDDGVFGRKTRKALKQWQAKNGYPATGFVTSRQAKQFGIPNKSRPPADRATSSSGRSQTRNESPTGRYIDGRGCIREANGKYVPHFREDCR